MASEVVKGRVEPTKPDRVKWGYAYYKRLVIHEAGGGTRELVKLGAAGPVCELIERGSEAEFHTSKHAGMLGIHGVRLADDSKHYAHFNNMELIFLIGAFAAAVGIILRATGIAPTFPITPIIIGSVLTMFYFIIRAGRVANRKAFEAA